MEKYSKNLWFRRKSYGWGWYPCCWKGWLAIAGFFVAIVLSAVIISNYTVSEESFVMIFTPAVFILAIILLILCFLRGQKPCWCWGGNPRD
jgi:hypothetical protein